MQDSLLEFYTQLWGDTSLHRSIWYGKKGEAPNRCEWFTNTQDAIKFATSLNESKRFNIYHACSLFSEKSRRQKSVSKVKALWLDLDLKQTQFNTLKELGNTYLPLFNNFSLGANFWVINTGNGFHIYWMLAEPISPDNWKLKSKELTAFCKQHSIPYERVTDSASLLRVPGSFNLKGDAPKEVKVILAGEPITFALPITEKPTTKLESNVVFDDEDYNLNDEIETQYPDSDAELVAKECALIGQFKKDGLDDSEPLWHFALGVVFNCVDGSKAAHQYSANSPRYNETETTRKLEAIETNNIRPCLCETFESHGCVHCETCKYKGKISSPIQLGIICKPIEDSLDDLQSDKQIKRAQQLIKLAPSKNWDVNDRGIYKIVDGERIVVSIVPFYIIDKFCEDVNDNTIITALIRAYTKIGIITFKIPLKTISEDRKLIGEFNARSIFPYDKKYFKLYITAYLQKISHIRPVKAVNSLGWQLDNSFVYGSNGEALDKDGNPQNCIIDAKTIGYLKGFESKGSLEEWKKVVGIYNSDSDFNPHLFSLLCSLGAPLLPMTSVTGFILSLQGGSGGGKSLSHENAMSVWGNPLLAGSIGTKDTNTSMLARLGAVKNLPLRLDEATTLSATKLSGLVYELVNGRGRARASIDGSLSNTAFEWQTLTLITTNRPLLEYETSQITEAERFRILELAVAMPDNMSELGKQIGGIIKNNYGVAGKKFIEWVMKNKTYTQEVLDCYYDKFKVHVDDSKRFWVNCGAIAFSAATIASEIGLFEIDLPALYKWFTGILQNQTALNEEFILESRGFESKEELVSALRDNLSGHILTVNSDGTPIIEPQREVKALIKQLDSGTSKLYIRSPVLNEFIKANFTDSMKKVKTDLGIDDAKLVRIGSRTGRFYSFDL